MNLKEDIESLKERLGKQMKLQMENLALIHRGIILSDWETLAGAGVGANDTLVLMNIKFGKAKRRFERLALLNI